MLVVEKDKVKSTGDKCSLTVNWYVDDLRAHPFDMKAFQTLVKVTCKDLIRTNALNGVSITNFHTRQEEVKRERQERSVRKKKRESAAVGDSKDYVNLTPPKASSDSPPKRKESVCNFVKGTLVVIVVPHGVIETRGVWS